MGESAGSNGNTHKLFPAVLVVSDFEGSRSEKDYRPPGSDLRSPFPFLFLVQRHKGRGRMPRVSPRINRG